MHFLCHYYYHRHRTIDVVWNMIFHLKRYLTKKNVRNLRPILFLSDARCKNDFVLVARVQKPTEITSDGLSNVSDYVL